MQATVLMPTAGDRAAVLPFAIESVLAQTVRDLELFVVGDGADERSCAVVRDYAARDARVRFFEHPKGDRRGEVYRHAALAEARGCIVAYLCDRDLMLPWHVETLGALLGDVDFCHTLRAYPAPDGRFVLPDAIDYRRARDRRDMLRGWHPSNGIPLSMAGHTLAAYRRLPWGWRTTPAGTLTDFHMWQQFLADGGCRAASSPRLTVLTFRSHDRRGWTVDERASELAGWRARMSDPRWEARLLDDLVAAFEADRIAKGSSLTGAARARVSRSSLVRRLRRLPVAGQALERLWRGMARPRDRR